MSRLRPPAPPLTGPVASGAAPTAVGEMRRQRPRILSATRSLPPSAGGEAAPASSRVELLAVVCVIAAILPVIVATARAISGDWRAIGDNAYFSIRAADVLTEHHPLLGSWTSASIAIGLDVNNAGPLLFDVLAIPVRFGGPDAGLAVGVALVNIASILGIAAIARRQAGPTAVVVAMAAATGLGWSLGSELLFEPWQPHSLIFPFLCFLFMVWALVAGDLVMLPWAVGLGSYIAQTHVGYLLLVPILGAFAVAAAGVRLWRSRRLDAEGWPALRRRTSRYVAVAVIVALACWAQPVIEQIFGEGRGNLGRLASSAGETGARVGLGDAPRYVATLLALPPWWGRPSVSEQFVPGDSLPSLASSLVGLGVLAVLLAVGLRSAWRRSDRPVASLVATGTAVLGVAVVGAATMPIGIFNLASHQMRWLWPVAAFLTFALVMAGVTAMRGRVGRIGVGLVALATVVLCGLNLPSMNARVGPAADANAIPTVRELLPQLGSLRDERGVLIDVTGERFAEPYTFPLMVELQRLDVPWFVEDAGLVRQVGPERRYDGQASLRLFVREGDAAREPLDGARRVAFVDALSAAEADELAGVEEDLRPFIADGGLVQGRVGSPDGSAGPTDDQLRDADYLFTSRALAGLVGDDRLRVPDRWAEVLARYANLQYQADLLTVAVFVEPLGDG
jgi:hypothetical protein